MQKNAATSNIGVNNQAAGGNRVLQDGLRPSLISRYTRDGITQQGVKYVMIFEGVNDIGSAGADQSIQTQIGNSLISAFKQIASDAHKSRTARLCSNNHFTLCSWLLKRETIIFFLCTRSNKTESEHVDNYFIFLDIRRGRRL
jgi:hypothetical protein